MIVITGPGEGETAYGHLLIRAWAPTPSANVVVDYGGSGTYADNVEIVVGDGAKLTVVAVQDWADDAVHVTAHHVCWAATRRCGTPT